MLQWIAADLVSGAVIGDLSTFVPDLPLRRTLSNYDTATGKFYLDGASPDWAHTVRAGSSVLAAYDEDDPAQAIVWAGYVTMTDPDNALEAVTVSLVTAEGYLARRYVPDVTYKAGTARDSVAADLVSKWAATGVGSIPGVPIVTQILGTGSPTLDADRVLQNTDNATVFDRITTLLAELGGEFTIKWSWSADRQHLVPTFYVGSHIGLASPTGVPAVTFEQPGPILSVNQPTDYSDGAGANVVTAYSSGQGNVTPYAAPVTLANPGGRPAFEYRYQPVASETRTAVLQRHASQALGILGPGAQPLSLVLAIEELSTGRRLGVDWDLGDDVGYLVEPCPAFVNGLAGTARTIALELGGAAGGGGEPTIVTPIFAQPEIYTEAGA